MIGFLKDLPDWSVGALLGGAAWFSVGYAVLAPRAMENDLVADVYPDCVAQLEEEQEHTLSRAEDRARRNAKYETEDAMRTLRARASELHQKRIELRYYHEAKRGLCSTGICELMPMALPEVNLSVDDIDRELSVIRKKTAALDVPFDIELPRAPSEELLKTCYCAAMQALAGKRTNYAISMASFRLISPTEISSVKQGVAEALRLKSCGTQPWERV